MLTFTRKSVNKNNPLYNSKRQKICSIRTNINRKKVYVRIKQSMLMFNSKSVNKNNSSYNSVGQKIKYRTTLNRH